MTKAKMDSQQWRHAQDSLVGLRERNVASVDSIVKSGMEANQLLRDKLSSAVSTSLEDVDVASKSLLFCIDIKIDLGSLASAIESNREWFEETVANNSVLLLWRFDVQDAEGFNSVVEAFGWEDIRYVGPHRGHILTRGSGRPMTGPLRSSSITIMRWSSVIISVVLTSRAIFQRMKNYTIYAVSITIRIVLGFFAHCTDLFR